MGKAITPKSPLATKLESVKAIKGYLPRLKFRRMLILTLVFLIVIPSLIYSNVLLYSDTTDDSRDNASTGNDRVFKRAVAVDDPEMIINAGEDDDEMLQEETTTKTGGLKNVNITDVIKKLQEKAMAMKEESRESGVIKQTNKDLQVIKETKDSQNLDSKAVDETQEKRNEEEKIRTSNSGKESHIPFDDSKTKDSQTNFNSKAVDDTQKLKKRNKKEKIRTFKSGKESHIPFDDGKTKDSQIVKKSNTQESKTDKGNHSRTKSKDVEDDDERSSVGSEDSNEDVQERSEEIGAEAADDDYDCTDEVSTLSSSEEKALIKKMVNMKIHVETDSNEEDDNLPLCPEVSPLLEGMVKVDASSQDMNEVAVRLPHLLPGGRYKPASCRSAHMVAIIIPFRNREDHLSILLNHLHPILQRQQIDYTFFVVEQAGDGDFNRGMLKNIGVLEAIKRRRYTCIIFHDVDLLVENDMNPYTCSSQPRHLSVAVNTLQYKLPYRDLFGGVAAMTVLQFLNVNGFSNKYWGWGGEDDDLTARVRNYGYKITRHPGVLSRYTMISHTKDVPNPERFNFLKGAKKRYKEDGLNTIRYLVLKNEELPLYTWLYVQLFPS